MSSEGSVWEKHKHDIRHQSIYYQNMYIHATCAIRTCMSTQCDHVQTQLKSSQVCCLSNILFFFRAALKRLQGLVYKQLLDTSNCNLPPPLFDRSLDRRLLYQASFPILACQPSRPENFPKVRAVEKQSLTLWATSSKSTQGNLGSEG